MHHRIHMSFPLPSWRSFRILTPHPALSPLRGEGIAEVAWKRHSRFVSVNPNRLPKRNRLTPIPTSKTARRMARTRPSACVRLLGVAAGDADEAGGFHHCSPTERPG